MAFAHLVYPGAVHSRLHHSLGAYHLMCSAIAELRSKHIEITEEEELAAKIAILLHDVGHGPFSHALEKELIEGMHHEDISLMIMNELNVEFKGALSEAIAVFTDQHPKKFLHQLVSGQLDVDRMDYLSRDSFFTGVSEGVIGYDRIIKMLTVHAGELMVEEKAVYSIEKFLVSRRLMYWQVYLHKTVLSAEMVLVKIFERAREILGMGGKIFAATASVDFFLKEKDASRNIQKHLTEFCQLDDSDVMTTVKNWMNHDDRPLALLCRCLVDRKLLKVRLQSRRFNESEILNQRNELANQLGMTEHEASYFCFTGEAINTMYNPADEKINILFKDGTVRNISEVDHALIHQQLSSPVKKYYFCFLRLPYAITQPG